ncbi:hypothetical protein C0Q70_04611 [Pomacea canaliculata]|uniref:Uncharacterized protein n=1 Tax=Pomacea canaliculata TaxID=400727 RepID=A0A2T7PIX7_POMCA|nr:hypothetical protein C0Q70_04611 [Pomacea canaliculata]
MEESTILAKSLVEVANTCSPRVSSVVSVSHLASGHVTLGLRTVTTAKADRQFSKMWKTLLSAQNPRQSLESLLESRTLRTQRRQTISEFLVESEFAKYRQTSHGCPQFVDDIVTLCFLANWQQHWCMANIPMFHKFAENKAGLSREILSESAITPTTSTLAMSRPSPIIAANRASAPPNTADLLIFAGQTPSPDMQTAPPTKAPFSVQSPAVRLGAELHQIITTKTNRVCSSAVNYFSVHELVNTHSLREREIEKQTYEE